MRRLRAARPSPSAGKTLVLRARGSVALAGSAALVQLAGACTLGAPSDSELMNGRPRHTDGGALDSSVTPPPRDAGIDASEGGMADAGRADAGRTDAGTPLTCRPACSETQVCQVLGNDTRCYEPAEALDGQRWEMPCGEIYGTAQQSCRLWPAGATTCPGTGYTPVDRRFRIGGQSNKTYDVTLRFTGVVEPKLYSGGTADGSFYIGGGPAPNSENYNSYGFTVFEPLTTYYLNYSENKADYVFPFDYERTIPIRGGAELRLFAFAPTCGAVLNCQDLSTAPNCTPFPVPDGPAAYSGHFIQVAVVRVKER
jgi:hypothetical protein